MVSTVNLEFLLYKVLNVDKGKVKVLANNIPSASLKTKALARVLLMTFIPETFLRSGE